MLGNLLRPDPEGSDSRAVRDPAWSLWGAGNGKAPTVDEFSSLQVLTVFGCATLIADALSTQPIDHYSRTGGVQREVSPRASWLDQPNINTRWSAFIVSVVWSLLFDGNAFVRVLRNDLGRVTTLIVLNPRLVTIEVPPGAPLRFLYEYEPIAGEVLFIPAYVPPGAVRGLNPIEQAHTAIGLAMSQQNYGDGLMANNAVPAGIIKVVGALTKDQRDELREGWASRHSGPRNAGKVGLLTNGAEFQQLTLSPNDAQFLESRSWSAADIAANVFHMPPDMVGVALQGTALTYQNLESRWTEFIRRACMPWMHRIEEAVSWQLLPRPQYVRFKPDVYMRADTKTRFDTYKVGIDGKFLLPNEARALEDRPPLDGGDEFPPAPTPTGPPSPDAPAPVGGAVNA